MREHWTLDPGIHFLNHGSYGATPRYVLAAQARWRSAMEREPVRFMVDELPAAWLDAAARLARFVGATPSRPQSNLAQMLGCAFARDGGVRCGRYAESSIPGIYAAGNITRDVQLAIVAAAEGAKAAFGINLALTREEFGPD